MTSSHSSQLMRRLVTFKGSRHNRTTQQSTDLSSPASPPGIYSENLYPNPNVVEPVSTYRTNFLGLFAEDGETPIAATAPPKLTDFVPPLNVHPDEFAFDAGLSEPSALPSTSAPREIQDFNYVGGWEVDENGEQRYVDKGHIEEVEDEGSGPVTVPSRLMDAMTLPASTTPPPGPSLRTRRELPQSPLVPNGQRFQRTWLAGITHTPTRFTSPLSQSISSLPPLRGFSQYAPHNEEPTPSPLHMSFTGDAAGASEPMVDSLSSLPPLRGFHHQPDYIIPEEDTLPTTSVAGDMPATFEPLTDSIASLAQLHGFHQFSPPNNQIPEEEEDEDIILETTSEAARAFEALGNSLESLAPQLAVLSPAPPEPVVILTPEFLNPIIVPQYHSTGNDERIIEQNLSSIEELSKTVETIRSGVFGMGLSRDIQPHLNMCENIAESLSRVRQTLMRRQTLPQEHWSHLSVSSRSKYESRLFSLQRCLRRLSDMSKRILEPKRLDTLLTKLKQHYEKLTNVADKLEDTFERLKLRHLYTVASKLTEEANKTRSTYMSAREMYVLKKSRDGNRSRSRRSTRPQTGGFFSH